MLLKETLKSQVKVDDSQEAINFKKSLLNVIKKDTNKWGTSGCKYTGNSFKKCTECD